MAVLCGLLLLAALEDLRRARIPNILIAVLAFYSLWYRWWDAGGLGVLECLKHFLIVFGMTYPLFKINALGAGDVKLLSVTTGCLTRQVFWNFLLWSLLNAAIISLIKILKERNLKERMACLCFYVTDVLETGQIKRYPAEKTGENRGRICLAVPVLFSVLMHVGGVY